LKKTITTPDDHVAKIGLCHEAFVKNLVTRRNFLWTIPCWVVYRVRLGYLFDELNRLLPGDIATQAPNLSAGSLYILSEACGCLLSHKKDKNLYLHWSKNRNVQETIIRGKRLQASPEEVK